MLCEECGEVPASVHLLESRFPSRTALHLCETCARKREFGGVDLLSSNAILEAMGWFTACGQIVGMSRDAVTLLVKRSSSVKPGDKLVIHAHFVPAEQRIIGFEFEFACPAEAKSIVVMRVEGSIP